MSGPLAGVRVVELSTFVAAPVTARLLADLGAEVIKVETLSGDSWRVSGAGYLKRFSEEENPIFDIYNIGKKHVSVNLKTQKGKEVFFKLLDSADVFITNLRVDALKRLGIFYDDIKDKYPKLVYAAILGYGEKGPEANNQAYDTVAFWARSGFLRDMATVTDNYFPVAAPIGVGDTASGYLLLAEICAALFRRTSTGTGDYVTSTLYHNGIFCMGTMVIMSQPPFGRNYPYNRVDNGPREGCYKCADGEWIYFALGNAPVNIPKYHKLIGHPELDTDPRFTPDKFWDNRYAYYDYFYQAFLSKPSTEWVELAKSLDLPLVKMGHFKDVSTDEQAWANGFIDHIEYPNGHKDIMPTSPIEMNSATPCPIEPVPANGTHTVEVLLSLGYSEDEVKNMEQLGAICSVNNINNK